MGLRIAQTGLVAMALAAAWLPVSPDAVEKWYSSGWYPAVQRLLTPVSNLIPFALFDFFVIGAVVFVAATVWRGGAEARRRRRLSPLLRAGAALCAGAAAVYLAFLFLWGFNYRRVPVYERLIVDGGPPDRAAVEKLLVGTIGRVNRLYAAAHQQGWRGDEWQDPQLKRAFEATQAALGDATPARTSAGPASTGWSIPSPSRCWRIRTCCLSSGRSWRRTSGRTWPATQTRPKPISWDG
jgi:hypothetical protein